tara:strand:- start:964 stop:1095 length:132 start_codon:yes stop_codon:yes gene_type:complete
LRRTKEKQYQSTVDLIKEKGQIPLSIRGIMNIQKNAMKYLAIK